MEITLSAHTLERIRGALGNAVDLSPAAVPAALARLAVEAPAVYTDVLGEISGSEVRLDSERERERRRRRGMLRRMLFGWAECDTGVGDRLIAKRRVAAAVPIGLAGLTLVLLLASGAVHHRHAGGPARPALLSRRSVAAARHTDERRTVPVAMPVPAGRSARPAAPTVPPDLLDPPTPASPSPVPSMADPAAPPNPVVFTRGRTAAAGGLESERPAPPLVYERAAVSALGGDPTGRPSVSAVIDFSSLPAPPPSTVPRSQGAAASPGSAGGSGDAAGSGASSSEAHWVPGQRVPAHLVTGVVAVAGGPPVPVIAQSDDPSMTWLGNATLGTDGLVRITFSPASPSGSAAVRGVALDPGRLAPGLAGRTTMRQPQAAGALVAAALQATADYAQALAQQGQVTLLDGWAQLAAGPTPPAWTYLAARLAQGIGPHGTPSGPVATTEIDAGTRLVILVTEAP
jgi:hypothetical protein